MNRSTHTGRILALSGRTITELCRDPLSWIFALAFPLLMLLLFGIIDSRISPEAGLTQFQPANIGPGILVFAQNFLTLFVALLVSGDRDNALLTRLQVTPAAPVDFHLGYALPAMVLGIAQGILTMSAAWVLSLPAGDPLSFAGCMGVVVCTLPFMAFCVGLGIVFGKLLSQKAAPGIASAVLSVSSFLGGCWMDVSLFGKGFGTVCTLLPWYPAVRLGRWLTGAGTYNVADSAVLLLWAAGIHLLALVCRSENDR
ncbi:MAG: ABC transporter permease [Clostridia bacterium]|nr:ABC transporter permease [Clostridia bacterium]